jgi:glycosyltransferase involved in cell wall biosynthesis
MQRKTPEPLITTIIPTYRRPQMLRRAIRSLLNQTFPHFQLCIYDNASGDETPKVVEEFARRDPRVKYFCHPHNIGAIANFNYGIRQVNTPFFSLFSDDDILLPDFYKITLEGLEKHPDAMFSAGATLVMNDGGKEIFCPMTCWPGEGYFAPPEGLFAMIGRWRWKHIPWTGILFRREVREQIGLLDEDLKYHDVDFQLRIAARFPYAVSKKPCAIFVRNLTSSSSNADISWFWPDWLKTVKKIKDDEKIPLMIRERTERKLLGLLKILLFYWGFLLRNDFNHSLRVVNIFKNDLDAKGTAFLLWTLIKVCHCYPWIYDVLTNARKLLITIRSKKVKQKYSDFVEILHS